MWVLNTMSEKEKIRDLVNEYISYMKEKQKGQVLLEIDNFHNFVSWLNLPTTKERE